MKFYLLILGILGVWRITHLFQAEDGPGDILVRFRRGLGNGFWGALADCFYCLSIWVALPFALLIGTGWLERGLLWPALSAGAVLIERLTARQNDIAPTAPYLEDQEADDDMLRATEAAARGHEETADAEGSNR